MNAVGINIDRYLLNCNYHLLITLLYISWIMLNTIQVVLVQGSCWEVLYNKQYITQQLLSLVLVIVPLIRLPVKSCKEGQQASLAYI